MDCSPHICANTSEDSGLGKSSRNESGHSVLFTPTSLVASRKRKSLELHTFKSIDIDSASSSPWIANSGILSSTLNESITTSVENCKLDSFSSKFYIDYPNFGGCKTISSVLKNVKEQLTPEKCSNKRCNTISSPKVSPMLKLGSPERNEILYSKLPFSSRFSSNKRSSPAKKCLFTHSLRKDPVTYFCEERQMYNVILKIFLSLSDENLYTCSKVSKRWRKAIFANENLKNRLNTFTENKIMNKENSFDSPFFSINSNVYFNQLKQSTPIGAISKIYEVTSSLTEGQHLEKCISCEKPVAIVQENISQCTNWRCGLIRCLKCNSISKTGPENFIDKCQQSILLIEKPQPKYTLLGSPKHYQNESGVPTFFLDDSINTTPILHSSGYATDTDLSQSSTSFRRRKPDTSQILKTYNIKVTSMPEKSWERRNSVLPVITSTKKKEEIIEPSSPPKVKHVAGSKKSKKMLKRLNW